MVFKSSLLNSLDRYFIYLSLFFTKLYINRRYIMAESVIALVTSSNSIVAI